MVAYRRHEVCPSVRRWVVDSSATSKRRWRRGVHNGLSLVIMCNHINQVTTTTTTQRMSIGSRGRSDVPTAAVHTSVNTLPQLGWSVWPHGSSVSDRLTGRQWPWRRWGVCSDFRHETCCLYLSRWVFKSIRCVPENRKENWKYGAASRVRPSAMQINFHLLSFAKWSHYMYNFFTFRGGNTWPHCTGTGNQTYNFLEEIH